MAQQTVPCAFDPSAQDALPDGSRPLGLVLPELPPRSLRVEIFGSNEKRERTHRGVKSKLNLKPGETRAVRVTLFSCQTANCL